MREEKKLGRIVKKGWIPSNNQKPHFRFMEKKMNLHYLPIFYQKKKQEDQDI